MIDWRVLAFSLAATVATVLLCGTAPAFRTASVGPMETLKADGRGGTGARRPSVLNSLMVVQVSVCWYWSSRLDSFCKRSTD